MANNFSLSFSHEIAAVQTVVDAIRAVDFPATDALINGIGDLSAEEKSLLGIGTFPGFQDYFNLIGDGADPSATYWNIVENGAGSVENAALTADEPGFMYFDSGAGAGDDAIAFTEDKIFFSLKEPVVSLRMRARIKFNFDADFNGESGIGFIGNDVTMAMMPDLRTAANHGASIMTDSGVPYVHSSDGAVLESTDISAFIADNTWVDIDIVISASNVLFYIDNVIRATHTVRVPSSVWQIACGSSCININNQKYLSVQYVKVDGE